jgi:low affinity Fe/Cu permease
MQRWFAHLLTQAGTLAARPAAFVWVAIYTGLWMVFDRASFDWHAATTLVTLCIALFIQRSEHRDTQALHAKLDELLRVDGAARNELMRVDQQEPEEIERNREGDQNREIPIRHHQG